jgi:hypothetical protein
MGRDRDMRVSLGLGDMTVWTGKDSCPMKYSRGTYYVQFSPGKKKKENSTR